MLISSLDSVLSVAFPFLPEVIEQLKADSNNASFIEDEVLWGFKRKNTVVYPDGKTLIHYLAFEKPSVMKRTHIGGPDYAYCRVFSVLRKNEGFRVIELGARHRNFNPQAETINWSGEQVYWHMVHDGIPDPDFFVTCSRQGSDQEIPHRVIISRGDAPYPISSFAWLYEIIHKHKRSA